MSALLSEEFWSWIYCSGKGLFCFQKATKNLDSVPSFYAHSPKHKEIWDTREEKPPAIFLSCVNPVVTAMPSRHIFLWCSLNSFKCYLLQTFSSPFFLLSTTLELLLIPWLLFLLNSFLFLLPTSKPWTWITGTFSESSWWTPVSAWVLAVYASIC